MDNRTHLFSSYMGHMGTDLFSSYMGYLNSRIYVTNLFHMVDVNFIVSSTRYEHICMVW